MISDSTQKQGWPGGQRDLQAHQRHQALRLVLQVRIRAHSSKKSPRLRESILCCSLHRAGTRFNPDEMTFKGQRRKKNGEEEAAAAAAAVATTEAVVTQQPCADVADDGQDFHAKLQGQTT